MNATKTMLKAIVATQLMQSIHDQRRGLTEAEIALISKINDEIAEAEASGILDQNIDAVFPQLIDTLDTLEEVQ